MDCKIPLSNEWLTYYDQIRDYGWPPIQNQEDLLNLPRHILKEVLFDHCLLGNGIEQPASELLTLSVESCDSELKPNSCYYDEKIKLELDQRFRAHNIEIHYNYALDGGGTGFGQRYRRVLAQLYPDRKFKNCFEWCSGPGFIGFDLLSRNICENLYVADIYQPCIDSIMATIENNRAICQGRVQYHHGQHIASLPADWKFDLVVSNPPHWNPGLGQFITKIDLRNRICCDNEWLVHKEFFENIRPRLMPGARILLQEQSLASGPECFKSFIEDNDMHIVDCHWESNRSGFYYLEVACNV